jgi:predicted ATPase
MPIGGEAGIGKTALAEAPSGEARGRGARVLVGRCYDPAETPPYGPRAGALARAPQDAALPVVPDVSGGGATGQVAFFAAVRGYPSALAAPHPLVLPPDDLHRADPASPDLPRGLETRPSSRSPPIAPTR